MTMLYVILGMGLLFIVTGFIVNEKNAKYLLSGYNTMSEKDRALVDLKNYIPFFRQFHLYFGFSFVLLGAALHYLYGESVSGIFIGLYPILAYIYFIWRSQEFSKAPVRKWEKYAIGILSIVLLVVGGLFYQGAQELEFTFSSKEIVINGMYGEVIPIVNIQRISLVEEIPPISYRKNGYSLGNIHKGYYKTETGKTIKLLLDSNNKPIIYIQVIAGNAIYFSSKSGTNAELYEELKSTLPSDLF